MSRPHVVTSSELQSLRDLELVTRATVEGLRQGLHRSPFHGYSAEFSQYRHYRPGDDLKYVDWKAFARTDRVYTRQFRETTNMSALFVIDVSGSMDFPQHQNQQSAISNRQSASGSSNNSARTGRHSRNARPSIRVSSERARHRRSHAFRAAAQRPSSSSRLLASCRSWRRRHERIDHGCYAGRHADERRAW